MVQGRSNAVATRPRSTERAVVRHTATATAAASDRGGHRVPAVRGVRGAQR
ncbi:hypothetical protein [Streptomyces taklimakanensis]|uniref:hypothetical protein n=1 Tax=Streptomyces taklimakanensis TaxID=2569853 RepID=UPI0012BA7C7E|nr:hypothetical protein [Streptomyces taklimakanensis]